jgi:hypothetical protein
LHTAKAGQPIVTETWYATLSDHHPTSRVPSRVQSHLRNQAPVQPNSVSQGPGGNLGRVQRTSVMSSSGSKHKDCVDATPSEHYGGVRYRSACRACGHTRLVTATGSQAMQTPPTVPQLPAIESWTTNVPRSQYKNFIQTQCLSIFSTSSRSKRWLEDTDLSAVPP